MFIGLDFETSGTNLDVHAPIQVGIAIPGAPLFVSDIGGWSWTDNPWTSDDPHGYLAEWDEDAYDVHRIDKGRLITAPTIGIVDAFGEAYIKDNAEGVAPAWRNLVGWNVASFDLRFLKKWMPWTAEQVSYRTVDLNAIVFSIVGSDRSAYYEVKDAAKAYAADEIAGVPESPFDGDEWHNAGYDALASLLSLEFLHDNYVRPPTERAFL